MILISRDIIEMQLIFTLYQLQFGVIFGCDSDLSLLKSFHLGLLGLILQQALILLIER